MNRQGKFELSIRYGSDTYILVQQIDESLTLEDTIQTSVRVHLEVISTANDDLHDLGTFDCVVLHLFMAYKHHSMAVEGHLCLVDRSEELYTDFQRMLKPPHLSSTLLYGINCSFEQIKNRSVTTLMLEAPALPVLYV